MRPGKTESAVITHRGADAATGFLDTYLRISNAYPVVNGFTEVNLALDNTTHTAFADEVDLRRARRQNTFPGNAGCFLLLKSPLLIKLLRLPA